MNASFSQSISILPDELNVAVFEGKGLFLHLKNDILGATWWGTALLKAKSKMQSKMKWDKKFLVVTLKSCNAFEKKRFLLLLIIACLSNII